ncbi:MAG: glycerol-3-phosphate dehydrogenase/oxidase [Verrucomicrobiota bacterium]|jgi:glycerol-3-phosphate dehydrogenase|nr:glycerol-3-phosphate dehydrogenase/oxidase [Verrucomicrobiota bacterium]
MKRDVQALQAKTFDVLIVGGGVYGAALAREAATRGLATALLEQADFGSGTSSSSLKIIHGGIRYLQQADVPRTLISIRERSILLRTAPQLVTPMACLMPTYGWFMKSRPVMIAGLLANDILSFNRNVGLPPSRRIPMGTTLSRKQILEVLPMLASTQTTGAAKWYDAFIYDSERLPLLMLKAAANAGAVPVNYVRADSFLLEGNRVTGVKATDVLSGQSLDVRAELVINAASAWSGQLLERLDRAAATPTIHYALAVNLILRGWPISSHSLGLHSTDNNRLYFFAPWRGLTIAGTLYRQYEGSPDDLKVEEADIEALLKSINSCLPGVILTREDVVGVHAGILPCRKPADPNHEPALLRHSRVIDHARHGGVEGLLSVYTIKYTTARGIAENLIRRAAKKLAKPLARESTRTTPLPGGDAPDMAEFVQHVAEAHPEIPAETRERLSALYGTELREIFALADTLPDPRSAETLLRAELLFAIRNEMPQSLGDLLFRRTAMASTGGIHPSLVHICADIMGEECGWNEARRKAEAHAVLNAPLIWRAASARPAASS